MSQDRAYIALLGLAEHFRTTRNIKKAIQCLVRKIEKLNENQFSKNFPI